MSRKPTPKTELAFNETTSPDPMPFPYDLKDWQLPYFEIVFENPDKKGVYVHDYIWGTSDKNTLAAQIRRIEINGGKVVKKYLHTSDIKKKEAKKDA